MKAISILSSLAAAGLASAQTAPDIIPTILGIRGANSAGCFSATSMNLAFTANNLKLDFADMRASVTPADPYDSEAAICVMSIELGAFPQGWRMALADITYSGHAKLSGGARVKSFAANAYFQWEHLKDSSLVVDASVKNASGSYLMNVPEMRVDFGATGFYDQDFLVNIPNLGVAWSPCFTGQEYTYDDKMQVQFQFQAYMTKEGFSKTGSGVFGRAAGPALTADFRVVWEKCDSSQRNAWGQFRMGDYETCQRIGPGTTDGQPTVKW
ncbi:uncharacterized protein GGS22DRAFT_193265 [Annulohypoxylon maeteangense]|uniref:uncharacterized protein n=1 Tax=Annulohypoxylon maeteangense TaxID=1927788 RepID=UPI002007E2D4|nr:uncharacterized protein GGS22DRAFT_193265 [Annulohypoxylon maeteangense]KAI0880495.1 hypothetical protein GGS22DRAFT_193265 [Annulohypoxylon maeteangense]